MYDFRKKLVVFLDILGFANHVADAAKSDDQEKARQIDGALLDISRLGQIPNSQAYIFSDSAIIAVHDNPEEVSALFKNLSIVSWSLMKKGVWVRGGISYGKISKDKNKPWGPSIVEAAKIEETVARYPRVAIGSSALGFLREKHLIEKLQYIRRDHDGVYFLASIESCIDICNSAGFKSPINLKTPQKADCEGIKQRLDDAFNVAVDSPEIFKKVSWLCRQWDKSVAEKEDLLDGDFRTKYFDEYSSKDVFGNGLGISTLRQLK